MVSDTLKVLVRVRPKPSGSQGVASLSVADKSIGVKRDKKGTSDFAFSEGAVLGADTTQSELFEHCDVASDVVNGLNCCIMAYGQTGSGKTHSMYGRGWEEEAQVPAQSEGQPLDTLLDSGNLGVVPRSITSLFSLLDSRATASEDFTFNVTCQVLQIYNERIYDLLGDKQRENPLQLRDAPRKAKGRATDFVSVHIPGLSAFRVSTKDDVTALLLKGLRNRAIRATDFNAESSRSHTILQLFVETEFPDEQGLVVLRRSTLSLVDLAGSEKWRPSLDANTSVKSQLHAENMRRLEQEKEMVNINSSLAALGNVVSALLEPGRRHIPYRDSSLTRLLQDALGGHGRTIIVATVHEDSQFVEETFSTLSFASRASRIKVTLQTSENISESITLEGAKRQILSLRARIQELTAAATASDANNKVSASVHSDVARISANANPNCPSCHDLVEHVRMLLQENLQLRVRVAHIGEVSSPVVQERPGILQSMLAPLGFYKAKQSPVDASSTNTAQPSPSKPKLSIKIPANSVSGPGQSSSPSPGPGHGAGLSSQSVVQRAPSSSTLTEANRVSEMQRKSKEGGQLGQRAAEERSKNSAAQPSQHNQPPQPRTAEAALAAARMALSIQDPDTDLATDQGQGPKRSGQTPRMQVNTNPVITSNVQTASSPISSPKHGAAVSSAITAASRSQATSSNVAIAEDPAKSRMPQATFSVPERYSAGGSSVGNSPGSRVSLTSSLTGSLAGSLTGSLTGSLGTPYNGDGSLLLSSMANSPAPSPAAHYDASRIERAIQGSERTLDAAHKGRYGSETSTNYPPRSGSGTAAGLIPGGSPSYTPSSSYAPNNAGGARSPSYAELASSSARQGAALNMTGTCAKHGLDECILCLMFHEKRQAAPMNPLRNSYEVSSGTGKPTSTMYSYNNIGTMGDITPSVAAFQDSLGIQSSKGLGAISAPSPTFGGFQRPMATGAVCQVHSVRDCLLCSLKQGSGPVGGSGGAYNSFAYSTNHTAALAPVKPASNYLQPNSFTSGKHADHAPSSGYAPQQSYGMYKPQSDSEDEPDEQYDNDEAAAGITSGSVSSQYGYYSHQNTSQMLQKDPPYNSKPVYQSSKIVYMDDEPTRKGNTESAYDDDENDPYVTSTVHPVSQSHTRGHSVPSSTSSGLYVPPSREEGGDDYDAAPVEAYVQQAHVVRKAPARKKRASALSANSRMQKVSSAYGGSSNTKATRRASADSESDPDVGYAQESAGADHAGYLYDSAPAAQKVTRRVGSNANSSSSLPQLAPARAVDASRVHSVVSANHEMSRSDQNQQQYAGPERSSKGTEKKKKPKGAPQLGGLAARRK